MDRPPESDPLPDRTGLEGTLLEVIARRREGLRPSDGRVADAILADPAAAVDMTLAALARAAGDLWELPLSALAVSHDIANIERVPGFFDEEDLFLLLDGPDGVDVYTDVEVLSLGNTGVSGADTYLVLPGMSVENIDIKLGDGTITIRGEKSEERKEEKEDYLLSERRYGEFQRTLPVPPGIDAEKVSAAFANGVLTVTLPKSPEARQKERRIEIGSAD